MKPTAKVLIGDCLERLKELPDNSVHMCVTSPPYWGLRDYGTAKWEGGDPSCPHRNARPGAGRADGLVDDRAQRSRDGVGSLGGNCQSCGAVRVDSQLGLEPTPDEYVAKMVEVFREVRRVLRDDGTLWLNLGDSYCSTDKWGGGGNGNSGKQTVAVDGSVPSWAVRERKRPIPGIKPKDLVGIPWRVAFALQADGWYLRQDIVWHKPNPMPESVTDRCTKSHEYMFLMAKSDRYYFDHEAIKEKSVTGDTRKPYGIDGAWAMDGRDKWEEGKGQQRPNADGTRRNKRSVWTVNTRSYREAHFATFPTKLIEPCIMAGTSEKGCCPTCGSPWERITERVGGSASVAGPKSQTKRDMGLVTAFSGYEDGSTSPSFTTVGWKPTCACQDAGDPVPCTVLEPFAGSGTTLFVSVALGRSAIGCELNPEYAKLIEKRLTRGVDKPEIDGSVARSEPVDTEPSSLEDLLGFDEEA